MNEQSPTDKLLQTLSNPKWTTLDIEDIYRYE